MIQTAIWQNEDFTTLPPDAQHVYLMLLSQAEVGATGRLAMTCKVWARQTNLTSRRLVAALGLLAEAGFTWDDPENEELVIRSWIRHNVESSPSMLRAAADQYHHIRSARLRRHLADEYPTVFGVPGGVHLPPVGVSDTLSDTLSDRGGANHGKRGTRSVVGDSVPQSSKDLEEETNQDDDLGLLGLLRDMGEPREGQAHMELRAWCGRISEHDVVEVRAALRKGRVKHPRAYVRRAFEKRCAARGASAA